MPVIFDWHFLRQNINKTDKGMLMKRAVVFLSTIQLLISPLVLANSSSTNNDPLPKQPSSLSFYVDSQSWSNIIPVKDLIEDEWRHTPESDASEGFTQNEIGLELNYKGFSLDIAHRYDYFVFSNTDTAKAFYLLRNKLALNTQSNYQLDLNLFHQQSDGVRLGYQFNIGQFVIEPKVGYWWLEATRESKLTGVLENNNSDNISGLAQLEEYYSERNFLKRKNFNNDWNTDGTGITFDLNLSWQVSEQLKLSAKLKDLFSEFTLNGSGYSEGKADTNGRFINSVGGIDYLPIYRGKETEKDHEFKLPKQITLQATFEYDNSFYSVKAKRQGNNNFYYLGYETPLNSGQFGAFLDVENLAPEFYYSRDWYSFFIGMDNIQISEALQLTLGLELSYQF